MMRRAKYIFTSVVLLLAFWLTSRISETIRLSLRGVPPQKIVDTVTGAINRAFKDIAARPLHITTATPDLIAGGVAVLILFLVILYNTTGKANRRPGEEQGSAAWATAADIAPLTEKDASQRLQLTATEALSINTRKTRRNLNVLVLGGSGTGKTRSYLMPNLSRVDMSSAVTDPKGEIYREVGPTLEARGYDVRVFNLIDLEHSHHFNAFEYFDEQSPETSVVQLAECIMTNTSGAESKGDQFWDRAERALLTALIAYAWATVADQDGREASLVDVVDLQKRMAASEEASDSYTSEVDLMMGAAREIVAEWREEDDGSADAATAQIMNVLDFATRQYRTFEQGAGETKKSIIISLGVRLAPLDMHAVRQIIADDNLGIDELGQRPMCLFLAIPDTHQTFRFLATIFWQTLFSHNIYLADHSESGHLPRQIHCFLDEFANIGKIPGFEQLIATIRSRGISTSIIMQSHAQGQQMWEKSWPSIVGNCDTLLYLGGRDHETHEWISKQLGDETVVTEETSRTYGATGSMSRSNHIIKRSLMTPDEVGRMSNDFALLFVRGLKPFKSRKAQIQTQRL